MKLHDTQTSDSAACQGPFWELIPWYVNKSLPDHEAVPLERHAKHCQECAAEISRQFLLAKEVAATDPFDVPLARSWDTLRAEIQSDTQARKPQRQALGRLKGFHGGLIAALGAVAVACLVLVIQVGQPSREGFQTLTNGSDAATPMIKFQATPGTTQEDLIALLAEHAVTLASGPSDQGIYTARLTDGTDVEGFADALMAAPMILFAAPEAE